MPEARVVNQIDLVLECRLLGVPVLRLNNAELDVRYRKVIALIAFLALEGGTSRAKLAGLLWSEVTDDAARRNLRRELHRLKNDLPALNERLEVSENSLQLRMPFQCDVLLFEQAISAGHVEQALEFYHGSLLQGLELEGAGEFHEWLDQKRERLERLQRRAMLECAELLETRGDWHKALEIHHGLLELDPFQERTHRDVMRLYSLLGEREAALLQFEKCQTMLETELGLEPLPETALLAESIRSLTVLKPFVSAKPVVFENRVALVGREQELQHLHETQFPVTLLEGEAGVGKTRLAEEWLFKLEQPSLQVQFSQAASQLPLQAIAQSLRLKLEIPEMKAKLEQLDPIWRQELARVLPEFAFQASEVTPVQSAADQRTRFLEGVEQTLRFFLAGGCLFLDDLPWADDLSLEVLSRLMRENPPRVLATARSGDLEINTQAAQFVTELEWAAKLERIKLEALEFDAFADLVREVAKQDAPRFAARLHEVTGGNPLFALESLRYLLERNEVLEGNVVLPPNLRAATLERLKRLGYATQRLLETASLTERGFSLGEIAPATALNEWESLEGLERAVGAQVLNKLEVGYAFSHDLIRQTLEQSLSAERRSLIHNQLATTLEARGASAARIAHHLEGADKQHEAVTWRVQAAKEARRVYAFDQAITQYALALNDQANDEQAFEIRMARNLIWIELYNTEAQITELEQLAVLAARLNNPITEAKIALQRAALLVNTSRMSQALVQARHALEFATDPGWQVTAHFYAGFALLFLGREDEAEQDFLEALELAPTVHARAVPTICTWLCHISVNRGDHETAQIHFDRAMSSASTSSDQMLTADALSAGARLSELQGNRSQAVTQLEQADDIAIKVGNINLRLNHLANLCNTLIAGGELQKANQRFDEWLELCGHFEDLKILHIKHFTLGRLEILRGNFGAAISALKAAIALADETEDASQQRHSRLILARLYTGLNHSQNARSLLEQMRAFTVNAELVEVGIEAEFASCEMLQGKFEMAQQRLEFALNAKAAPDHDWRENRERAQVLLGMAYLKNGLPEKALEIIENFNFSPASKAAAFSVQLIAASESAMPQARALLLQGCVPPLEALELRRAMLHALEIKNPQRLELVQTTKTLILEMKASLEEFSELQKTFLEKNHDLTEF